MALETVIGYLVALALPLWLVVEGIKHMERAPHQREGREEAERRSATPVTGAADSPIRPEITTSRQPRIAA
jgi:hypothetical protein